jgi:hypothetical protein
MDGGRDVSSLVHTHLIDDGLVLRAGEHRLEVLRAEVAHADAPQPALVLEVLEHPPRRLQLAGRRDEGVVDEVQVRDEAEPVERGLHGRGDLGHGDGGVVRACGHCKVQRRVRVSVCAYMRMCGGEDMRLEVT